jgi:type IV secretion system protein VirB5
MFRRPLQRYATTPEPATPYQRAAQIWDDRIGSSRVQAKNWRLMALGGLGLAFVLSGALAWQSGQSRIVPYVVQVDKFGAVQAVGPAVQNYVPTDAEIAWYLGRFISGVRSLSLDPVVVRRNWLEAYDYATDRGATFLNEFARANDPFKAIGERTVSVQVSSVVRMSDKSFQVKWNEQTFEQGALAKTERWTAILSVVTKTPTTAEVLKKNPLGLYVNAVNWSRELDN